MKEREIRAAYDEKIITVYQAYNSEIAKSAVKAQTFLSPPFKRERMTWIKPSFLWMMYRSGWASKIGQEHILSIKIKREGFEWALCHSCLSHFDKGIYCSYDAWKEQLVKSPARIQWDPERDIFLQPTPVRSIQVGLSGLALDLYINNWIVEIKDITSNCNDINLLLKQGKIDEAKNYLPTETIYPLSDDIKEKINILI